MTFQTSWERRGTPNARLGVRVYESTNWTRFRSWGSGTARERPERGNGMHGYCTCADYPQPCAGSRSARTATVQDGASAPISVRPDGGSHGTAFVEPGATWGT